MLVARLVWTQRWRLIWLIINFALDDNDGDKLVINLKHNMKGCIVFIGIQYW